MSQIKPKIIFALLFSLVIFNINSQTKPVTGDWLLTLIEAGKKNDQPYIINHFDANGDISIYSTKIAEFTQRNQTIDFKSERVKFYNGRFHILKHTPKELILGGDSATFYYKRAYNPKQQNNPVYQNLIGTWLMHGTRPTYIRLEKGGRFIMLNLEEDMNVTTKGSWLFIPDEKAFVVLADVDVLRRKDSILNINKEYMEVLNKGIQYQLEKQPEVSSIKHLQIDEDSLPEPTEGQPGLPWNDDDLWMFLPQLKNLHYKRFVYHPEVKVFSEDDISVDVLVNPDKQSIKFNSYKEMDEERIPFITRTKGPLMESYNRFFPQKDLDRYRIIDRKRPWKIGDKTYECTVINGIIGDEQYQYWMINNLPGVFVKIIHEAPGLMDEPVYIKYELDNINKR